MKVVVKNSRLAGKGLFAAEDIPWGVRIVQYTGETITDAEANRRFEQGADAIFELGGNRMSPWRSNRHSWHWSKKAMWPARQMVGWLLP